MTLGIATNLVGVGVSLRLVQHARARLGEIPGKEGEAMAEFSQPVLLARAGKPLRLRIVNPDSPYHTDGGGWHQLAIPALKVDVRVPPRSSRVVEIPAAPPGEYGFYCDVCCGGKANPTMRGVLRVEA